MEVQKDTLNINIIGIWKIAGNSMAENKCLTINFPDKSRLNRMTLFEKNNKILITETPKDEKRCKSLIRLCDLEGKLIDSFNPCNKLTCPGAICVLIFSNKEEIFIANKEKTNSCVYQYVWKILVFQSFKFKDEFIYSECFSSPHVAYSGTPEYDITRDLRDPNYMQIDNEFNNARLYISDGYTNKITIYNTNNYEVIDKIEILGPRNMKFSQNHIYVTCFDKSVISHACIFKIKKDSLEVEKIIETRGPAERPIHLLGFGSLANINLLNYALNLETKKIKIYYSVIDENGNFIASYLTDLKEFEDALILKNKIFTIDKATLRSFDFKVI